MAFTWVSNAEARERDLQPVSLIGELFWFYPDEGVKSFILYNPAIYLIEVLHFSLAIIPRIIRFVARLIRLIVEFHIALFKCFDEESRQSLKDRAICFGVSFLRIVDLPLLILCPPLGHKVDGALYKLLPGSDSSLYLDLEAENIFDDLDEDPLDENELEEAFNTFDLAELFATKELLQSEYKKLAMEQHPDKNPQGDMSKLNISRDYILKYADLPEQADEQLIKDALKVLSLSSIEDFPSLEDLDCSLLDPSDAREMRTAKKLIELEFSKSLSKKDEDPQPKGIDGVD